MAMIYLAFLFFTCVVLAFVMYQLQYFMLFTPVYYRKEGICHDCEYLSITTEDGVELEGVVYEPHNPYATILFFGGRSDDSVARINTLAQLYPTLRIVTFNYRSYGRSGGVADEKHLLDDGLRVAKRVGKHYGSLYILGFSLGASIGAYVASKHATQGVFLVGAFDSIPSLVKHKYGFFIPHWFIRYRFDTASFVQHIKSEVCLFVSKDDTLTPIQNSRKLKEKITNLACYIELEGLSHKELLYNTQVVAAISRKVHYENNSL
jgi:alpha/beta superfamily hydrolase